MQTGESSGIQAPLPYPKTLDRPGKPKQIFRVNWELPAVMVFNNLNWKSFSCIPESELITFKASIVEAAALWSGHGCLLILSWSCDLAAHCTVQRSRNWSAWQGLLPSFWHIHLNILFLYFMPIYALNNCCLKKKQKMQPTCFGGSKVFIKVLMYDGSTLWCRCSNMRRVCLWTFSLLETPKNKQEIWLKN